MPSQYKAIWSTPGGGVGFSVFHFDNASNSGEADATADLVHDFFDTLKGIFPDEVSISFDSELLNMTSAGVLTGVFPVAVPANVVGINSGTYNRAAGARVDWSTGALVAGRRLNGRTYLVPTSASVFDTTGLVTTGNVAAIQSAADNLILDSQSVLPLVVWSRTHAFESQVDAASVPTQGAILRGRRD